MFCNKCGRQIEDGSRFCPSCGAIQETYMNDRENPYGMSGQPGSGLIGNLSAFDVAMCAIYVIILIRWTIIFFVNLKNVWIEFSYLEADVKFVGILLNIIPYILIFCLCIIGVAESKKKNYHISVGIIIVGISLIMKVGAFFLDTATFGSYLYALYITLASYGAAWVSTIILGAIAAGLTYAKAMR